MANKSKVQQNLRRRRLVAKYESKRAELRAAARNKKATTGERFKANQQLASLPRNSAKNRVRNRCGIDGRPRGYYRKFDMSRIWFRDLAGDCMIPGVVKSSW